MQNDCPLVGGDRVEQPITEGYDRSLCDGQHLAPLCGQRDDFLPPVLSARSPTDQPAPLQPGGHIRHRRPIDRDSLSKSDLIDSRRISHLVQQ